MTDLYDSPAMVAPADLPAALASAVTVGRPPLSLGNSPSAVVILVEIDVAGMGA